MKTQDLKYIITKRTQEQRKIEKLQSQLHLTSVEHNIQNKHIYFEKNDERLDPEKERLQRLATTELPEVDLEALEVPKSPYKIWVTHLQLDFSESY